MPVIALCKFLLNDISDKKNLASAQNVRDDERCECRNKYHSNSAYYARYGKWHNDFGKYLGLFFLLTFALATLISQFYLGESNMIFITKKMKIGSEKVFKIAFKCLFITGIVLGVYLSLDVIFEIIDYSLITFL